MSSPDRRTRRYQLTVHSSMHRLLRKSTMLYAEDTEAASRKAREWLATWRLTHHNGMSYDGWTLALYVSPYQTPRIVAMGDHLKTKWTADQSGLR